MTRNPAGATLATRHVSVLRSQLLGALAMGWALGGCFEDASVDPARRSPPQIPTPEPPTLEAEGPCFGDAGVQCYPLQVLDEARVAIEALGADAGYPEPTVTAEGCLDPTTAQWVIESCGPFPVSTGVRRGDTAELAWQFVAWAVQRGGEPIARVLQNALKQAESAERATDTCRESQAAPPEWRRAGRLSDAERASLNRVAVRDIARPMLEALLSRRRATQKPPASLTAGLSCCRIEGSESARFATRCPSIIRSYVAGSSASSSTASTG